MFQRLHYRMLGLMTHDGSGLVHPLLLYGWHEHRLAVMLAIFRSLPMGLATVHLQHNLGVGSKEKHDRGRPPEGNPEAGEVVVGRTSEGRLSHVFRSNVRPAWCSGVGEK